MKKMLVLGAFVTVITGCSGPFPDMPDAELRNNWARCKANPNPSTTFAIRCDNYKRECEHRQGKGNNVCAL